MDDTNQLTVKKTVCEFISKNPAVKSNHIQVDMALADLNVDSLEKLSIGMDLEEEYSIEFIDEEIEAFVTVADVIVPVEVALAAKAASQVKPVLAQHLQDQAPESHHSA
ncbi:MAG: acyl carrier protein [Porticoccaceae bacterium]|nr:acyl carrier protein [Porticoccaceae bacterium]MDG1312048.1 acyl carrier protein [Porticoccaceae bacterium]